MRAPMRSERLEELVLRRIEVRLAELRVLAARTALDTSIVVGAVSLDQSLARALKKRGLPPAASPSRRPW